MPQTAPRGSVEPLRPGDPDWVGPFELLGVLGTSGYAVVYLGERRDGRRAAVKIIRAEVAGAPGFRASLERELWAASHIRDTHVAKVVDGDLDAHWPWVASEYVAGPSLEGRVRQSGPLPADRVMPFAWITARALAAIHECDLVHGDVKPASIILGEDGPTLIDVGVANALAASHLARTGRFADSLAWAAPEQIAEGADSRAADVFAWGLLVGYAATGRHPYGEGQPDDVAGRILRQDPDLRGLPAALAEPVAAALQRNPRRRCDAETLLQILHDTAGAEPAEAGCHSSGRRGAAVTRSARSWPWRRLRR